MASAAFHLSTLPTSEGVSLPASTSASINRVLGGSSNGRTSFVHFGLDGVKEGSSGEAWQGQGGHERNYQSGPQAPLLHF